MEQIISFDKQLLLDINHWTSPWADQLMLTLSKVDFWFPMYLIIALAMFFPRLYSPQSLVRREYEDAVRFRIGMFGVIAVVLCVILTDQISDFVRDRVCRPRPGHDPVIGNLVRLIDGPGSQYGFFSGHAANTVGFAVLTSLIFRRRAWKVFSLTWALLVCYSRIYLGRHFPGDVLAGILCGAVCATVCWLFYKVLMQASRRSDSDLQDLR